MSRFLQTFPEHYSQNSMTLIKQNVFTVYKIFHIFFKFSCINTPFGLKHLIGVRKCLFFFKKICTTEHFLSI